MDFAGTYGVTVTSTDGCTTTSSIAVRNIVSPAAFADAPIAACNDQTITLTAVVSGTELVINWININGQGTLTQTDFVVTQYIPSPFDLDTITFQLTVRNGCDTLTRLAKVRYYQAPNVNFTVSDTTIVIDRDPVRFTITNPTQGANYLWNFGNGVTSNQVSPPDQTFSEQRPYPVTLRGAIGGCRDSSTVVINAYRLQQVFVPNVFSPRAANPENQTLKVYGVGIVNSDFEFRIYSRWGDVVYETTDFTQANIQGWAGTNGTTSATLPLGGYTYTLRGRFSDGSTFEKTGVITLLR